MKKFFIIFGKLILSVVAVVLTLVVSFRIVEWMYPEVPENLADLFTCWILWSTMSGISLVAIWDR